MVFAVYRCLFIEVMHVCFPLKRLCHKCFECRCFIPLHECISVLCFKRAYIHFCIRLSVCVHMWVENLRHVTAGGPMPSGRERAERGAVVAMETPPCGSWSGSVKSQPAERETAEEQNQRKEGGKKEQKKINTYLSHETTSKSI